MMKIEEFSTSLLFGGVAAVGIVFAQHLFAPILGSESVLALYLSSLIVIYSVLIGTNARDRIAKAAAASLGAVFALSIATQTFGIAIGLTVVLAFVRTGMNSETRTGRRLVAEMVLGVGGLLFASYLASPGWLGSSAGIWGFVLVQSLYFLAPLGEVRLSASEVGDPFDRARDRLVSLLDEFEGSSESGR